jgi:CheY-like chemotaxis protein
MSNAKGADHFRTWGPIEVLVVQSNPADTLLTVEAFRAAGVTSGLRCVEEGQDALSYVRRSGKYRHVRVPDLVFLDLSQPRISGLELLKVIKSTPELMHIPIVVAAGAHDPKFVRAVYELNGNCFIRKPSEMAEFLRFIQTCYQFWSHVVTLSPRAARVKRRVSRLTGERSSFDISRPSSASLVPLYLKHEHSHQEVAPGRHPSKLRPRSG